MNKRRALAVASGLLTVAYVLTMWLLLIVGIASQNWWLFAPAAFFLIYERLNES